MRFRTYQIILISISIVAIFISISFLFLYIGTSKYILLLIVPGIGISVSIFLTLFWSRKKEHKLIIEFDKNNGYQIFFHNKYIGEKLSYQIWSEYLSLVQGSISDSRKKDLNYEVIHYKLKNFEEQAQKGRYWWHKQSHYFPDSILTTIIKHHPGRPEHLLFAMSFWIPRKYREALVGDIMEDCQELRSLGKSKRRIFVHIFWQLAVVVVTLLPANIFSALKREPRLRDETRG